MTSKPIKTAIRVAVVLLVVVYLGITIYRNAAELATLAVSFSWLPFIASTLLYLVLFFMQAFVWHNLLVGVSHPISLRQAIAVWFASQTE